MVWQSFDGGYGGREIRKVISRANFSFFWYTTFTELKVKDSK